jgi:hypothetical protein
MHTDSGLMTVVVCTDEPGLEVLDPLLGHWVAIERLIHAHCADKGLSHRHFACVFYSDSLDYLVKRLERPDKPRPCFHRVQKTLGGAERCSIVFKQRTAPLATAARYQEDYYLATLQLASVRKAGVCPEWKFPEAVPTAPESSAGWTRTAFAVGAVAAVAAICLLLLRKNDN